MRALLNNNRRTLLDSLVCDGLGYCCPMRFFKAHKDINNATIGLRLGVDRKTVGGWRSNPLKCTNADNCINRRNLTVQDEVHNPNSYNYINVFLEYLSLGYTMDLAFQKAMNEGKATSNAILKCPNNIIIKRMGT